MLGKNSSNFTDSDPSSNGNSLAIVVAMTLVYIAAISVGTLGNAFVILVVLFNRSMHSSTNFFISSLAAADLIVTSVCMPFFFVYNVLTWPVWPFGRVGCRILSYLVHVSVMASALSLLAISYDRFFSIFFPLKRLVTLSRAKKALSVIWFVSPLLLVPSSLHHDTVSNMSGGRTAVKCIESWDTIQQLRAYQMYRISFYFLFVFLITVVYCLIGVRLYRRQQPGEQTAHDRAKALLVKRKIIRMLFLVVAMFTLSWLPYMINKLLNIFPPRPDYEAPNSFVLVGNFLGLLNSVVNPIIYAIWNKTYRTGFKYAIRCKFNFDREERRRTMSKTRNGSSFSQSQSCKRRNTDRRKSSLLTENFVLPGDECGATSQPVCLSFVANSEIPLENLSNTTRSSNNGLGGRRVSFGGKCMLGTEPEKKDGKDGKEPGENTEIDCAEKEQNALEDPGASMNVPTLLGKKDQDPRARINESYAYEKN